MKIISPVRYSIFVPEQEDVFEHMCRLEPAQRDAVGVVVKADDGAGSEITMTGGVVYGFRQRLTLACLQIQNTSSGAVSLRRRNYHVQPLAGFINMDFIHSSLIDRAGVVEEDPVGRTLVNQIEDWLTVISSRAQM